MQAWADTARYTPADQMLSLTGSPRVDNGGMETTAKSIRINRATGDAFADDDVKSTYNELKEQPDGALLASSSPIHVTAHTMAAHTLRGVVALFRQRASMAGRECHRGADHSVRPRSQIRDRPRHSNPARADDSRPNREDPLGQRESGGLAPNRQRIGKSQTKLFPSPGPAPLRSLHRSSPTPIPSVKCTTKPES